LHDSIAFIKAKPDGFIISEGGIERKSYESEPSAPTYRSKPEILKGWMLRDE
jgi:hypothetical protein